MENKYNDKKMQRAIWGLFGVLIIMNLISYNFLPSKVALQITFSGELTNFVSKIEYCLIAPAIFMVVYMISKNKLKSVLGVGIVMVLANLGVLFCNLLLS